MHYGCVVGVPSHFVKPGGSLLVEINASWRTVSKIFLMPESLKTFLTVTTSLSTFRKLPGHNAQCKLTEFGNTFHRMSQKSCR
uniref:Uncharacterized protein n=1 Tax=Anguilla anguilla TaxID=7936 RepID=A0A0E9X6P4_ANGAN